MQSSRQIGPRWDQDLSKHHQVIRCEEPVGFWIRLAHLAPCRQRELSLPEPNQPTTLALQEPVLRVVRGILG